MPACPAPGCARRRERTYTDTTPGRGAARRMDPDLNDGTPAEPPKSGSRPEPRQDEVPLGPGGPPPPEAPSPCRRARAEEGAPRRNYTKEAVACALGELDEGGSYRKVAVKYGIPHTTLRDHRKKRYAHNPHPNRALMPEEEDALVSRVLRMSERGLPVTGAAVKDLALAVIRSSRRSTRVNLDKGLSSMWWSRFRARHPELAARAPDRAGVLGPGSRAPDGLFSTCELLYRKHGFEEKPHLVFSCGEAALGEATLHCCVSAAGSSIPPFVVHPRRLPGGAASSPGGLVEGELLLEWLDHFVKFAPAERPLLLFWGESGARVSGAAAAGWCGARGVEVVRLPRPLDAAVFGPLRAAFVAAATRAGPRFPALLREAYEGAATAERIREGFRIAGLFPLSREADDVSGAVDAGPLSMPRPCHSTDPDPKVSDSHVPILLTGPGGPAPSSSSQNPTEVYYARPVVHAKDPDGIPGDATSPHILKVSSKDERTTASPDLEERSSPQDVKSLELYHGSSIFKSGEVLVNTRCLMELFRFCSVCLVECCVSVEGQEELFSVTQACQSCGFHREWSNHPAPADRH